MPINDLKVRAYLKYQNNCSKCKYNPSKSESDEPEAGSEIDLSKYRPFMTRGASETYTFDLSSQSYDLDIIEQIIFNFSQDSRILTFNMFDDTPFPERKRQIDSGEKTYEDFLMPRFALRSTWVDLQDESSLRPSAIRTSTGNDVQIKLTDEDTSKFFATDTKVKIEIVVKLDSDPGSEQIKEKTVLIYALPSVKVLDTIYGEQISTN